MRSDLATCWRSGSSRTVAVDLAAIGHTLQRWHALRKSSLTGRSVDHQIVPISLLIGMLTRLASYDKI